MTDRYRRRWRRSGEGENENSASGFDSQSFSWSLCRRMWMWRSDHFFSRVELFFFIICQKWRGRRICEDIFLFRYESVIYLLFLVSVCLCVCEWFWDVTEEGLGKKRQSVSFCGKVRFEIISLGRGRRTKVHFFPLTKKFLSLWKMGLAEWVGEGGGLQKSCLSQQTRGIFFSLKSW